MGRRSAQEFPNSKHWMREEDEILSCLSMDGHISKILQKKLCVSVSQIVL